jgi:phosphohistidine phosphatase SixA
MQIVIVRHASHDGPRLTPRGRQQVERLAGALKDRGVHPTLILSSEREHAWETSQILARRLAGDHPAAHERSGPLYPVPGNPGDFEDVVRAARLHGIEPAGHETVMLVGHEARVSGLVMQLTGARTRPVPAAGAVAVQAQRIEDLLKGRGTIDFRYPVVDHQEAALRPKVQSKMTVATLLAGFVSAALVTNLFVDDFTGPKQAAAVLLTLSLALLVATVYIYDELGMPEGYWARGTRSRLRSWLETRRELRLERGWRRHASGSAPQHERLREARWIDDDAEWWPAVATEHEAQVARDGPMYTWMVATWRYVFTPAILLALASFGILVFDAGSTATGIACSASVLLALAWLALRRPPLGMD